MNFFYAIFSIEKLLVHETGFSVKVPEK